MNYRGWSKNLKINCNLQMWSRLVYSEQLSSSVAESVKACNLMTSRLVNNLKKGGWSESTNIIDWINWILLSLKEGGRGGWIRQPCNVSYKVLICSETLICGSNIQNLSSKWFTSTFKMVFLCINEWETSDKLNDNWNNCLRIMSLSSKKLRHHLFSLSMRYFMIFQCKRFKPKRKKSKQFFHG